MPLSRLSFRRGSVVFLHDLAMAAASFLLALYLRLGDDMAEITRGWLLEGTLIFTGVCAAVFASMRLYRGVWRYASLNDLLAITRASSVAVLIFVVLMFAWIRLEQIPRSLPFINWFVLMALLGGPRFLYRVFKDRHFELRYEDPGRPRVPVLLVGAGDGAELFIRALNRGRDSGYRVVGIVSEQPGRVGRHIHGIDVLGTADDLTAVVAALGERGERPQRLVLTKDDMDGVRVRRLVDAASELGMTVARVPRLTDFKDGVADKVEVRPIAVEDLLGRPQPALDRAAMAAFVAGRRVLVTGAGGSIGAELVRQVADLGPATLTLLDISEFNLYAIDLETAGRHPDLRRAAVIADVRDAARLARLFAEARPEVVFHAAALKHVPLVEANPAEGVLTNVVGTRNVADACVAHDVGTMVLISTDKAVNPTSVMGATKRIAERYCQALDIEAGAAGTRFVTVRFGNVLGSTGSVVPLFQRQLAAGGPLTVTHPEMKRYFMTVREAVELVLQASAHGSAAREEEGRIYVLDMGEPVRIIDLARQMIRLAGLRPDVDVRVEIVGLRPGEKLFEEIFHGAEPPVPTACKGVLLASPRAGDKAEIARGIDELAAATGAADGAARVPALIRRLVPEYAPPEEVAAAAS
jgi:O-antigen biosynthesis protein WbqV